ncbi:MAG: formate/nitrite transporter family protein [Anaeroplasmataceae bacterium]
MNNIIRTRNIIISSTLAGIAIGLGGMANLALIDMGNPILGAIFFAVGLLIIISFDLHLVTGRAPFAGEKTFEYILDLIIMAIFNILGAVLMGLAAKTIYKSDAFIDIANNFAYIKEQTSIGVIILQSLICGALVFISVHGYNKSSNSVAKILFIFIPIPLFILTGLDHCIANAFNFTVAGFTWTLFIKLLVSVIFNCIGGFLFYELFKLSKVEEHIRFINKPTEIKEISDNENKKTNNKNEEN